MAHDALVRLMHQMTAWARGVAINGVATGFSIGTGLWLVGVQPALVFGVLAFFGEFIPNIGRLPRGASDPVCRAEHGATKFWLAPGVILLVYQVELNLLVPFVLGREMRLNPVTILFFIVATGSLLGLPGAILAVPTAAFVQIVIDEFYLRSRKLNYFKLEHEAAGIIRGESAS